MGSRARYKESPSQTAGPYVHIGCTPNFVDVQDVYSADPVLALIEPARRKTLIASQQGGAYVFNVRLQGENETVFFDL